MPAHLSLPHRSDQPRLVAAAAASLAVVLLLAVSVATRAPGSLDTVVFGDLHGRRGSEVTEFASELTWFGDGLPLVAAVLSVGMLSRLFLRRWRPLSVACLAVGLGAATSTAVKHLIERGRPPAPGWLAEADGYSFPSGHTTAATAAFLGLALAIAALVSRRWSKAVVAVGLVASAAIGWTRLELGVHWPTDVLAGWAVGAAAACAAHLLIPDRRGEREGLR